MSHLYAIEEWVCLLIMLWVFYNPWQSLILDITRDRLFKIRDRYFMLAATKDFVAFDSQEYMVLREYLNNNIRYLSKINLTSLLANKIFISRYKDQSIAATNSIQIFIENCKDEKLKSMITYAINEANMVIAASVILRSIILLLLFPAYLMAWILTNFSITKYIQNIIGIDSEFEKIEREITNKKYA